MIVVIKSKGNICPYCGEDKLVIVSELSFPEYEVAKNLGLLVEWVCPECEAENHTRITHADVDFYMESVEKN